MHVGTDFAINQTYHVEQSTQSHPNPFLPVSVPVNSQAGRQLLGGAVYQPISPFLPYFHFDIYFYRRKNRVLELVRILDIIP